MGTSATINLLANVGQDPEIRKTQNGEVCNFTVAVNRRRGQEEATDWYKCVTFSEKLIETIEKFVKKGSHVWIVGRPAQTKWTDRDGNERTTFEVLISELTLDDPPPAREGGREHSRDAAPARGGERGRDDGYGRDNGRDAGRPRDDGYSNGRPSDRRNGYDGAGRPSDRRDGYDSASRPAGRDYSHEPTRAAAGPAGTRAAAPADARAPGGGNVGRWGVDDEIPFSRSND